VNVVLRYAKQHHRAKATLLERLVYRTRIFLWTAERAQQLGRAQQPEPLQPADQHSAPQSHRQHPIDADTPLMEAGIMSQQAVRLVARLRELSGAALPVTLVFEFSTPRAITTHLQALPDCNADTDVELVLLACEFVNAQPVTKILHSTDTTFGVCASAKLPASTFQKHFLLLHLLQPNVAAFSLPVLIEMPRLHEQPLMRAALQILVRRHAALRTVYAMDQSGVLQIVLPADGFSVPLDECTESEWVHVAGQALAKPFSLIKTPPLRALLLCSATPCTTRLLMVADHIAIDYASTLLVHKETSEICESLHRGVHPRLPKLLCQYADFSLWQQRQAREDEAAELMWWRTKLDGAPQVLTLPVDHPRAALHAALGDVISVRIDEKLGAALNTFSERERVSKLSCLLATWTTLVLHLSSQDQVVLGTASRIEPCPHFTIVMPPPSP
jgi:hypothetical protein